MRIKIKFKTWSYLGFAIILISGILVYYWIFNCRGSLFCLSYSIYIDPRYRPLYGFGSVFLIILGSIGLISTFILTRIKENRQINELEGEYSRQKKIQN